MHCLSSPREALAESCYVADAAAKVGARRVTDLKDFVSQCDVITVNAPLHEGTMGLINADLLKHFKKVSTLSRNACRSVVTSRSGRVACQHRAWRDLQRRGRRSGAQVRAAERVRRGRVERPAGAQEPPVAADEEPARRRKRHDAALLGHDTRRAGAVRGGHQGDLSQLLRGQAARAREHHHWCRQIRDDVL